jgi:uncharacterized DUF497 family protein
VQYDFEWDLKKAGSNRRSHGVTFEEAATVFQDPQMITLYDSSHSSKQDRWITLGTSAAGRVLVVNHTFPKRVSEHIPARIISSRKATSRERRQYREL